MTKKLFFEAVIKYLCGVILVGALLFLPAGSLAFFVGWLFMAVLFLPMLIAGIVMMIKNPALLKSRLDAKEKQKNQKGVIKLSGLMFIVGFILAGLDYRFCIFPLPRAVSLVAAVMLLLAYAMFAEVLRENTYLSRTVKVTENQKVIDSGLYGIVRHPMYSATLILFIMMPLVLGSLIAFAVFLAYPFIITVRIRDEEKLLARELDGYTEYMEKVKYRLIPFIW